MKDVNLNKSSFWNRYVKGDIRVLYAFGIYFIFYIIHTAILIWFSDQSVLDEILSSQPKTFAIFGIDVFLFGMMVFTLFICIRASTKYKGIKYGEYILLAIFTLHGVKIVKNMYYSILGWCDILPRMLSM